MPAILTHRENIRMNVRDIAEIREELKAKVKAAEDRHRDAVLGGQSDDDIQIEEDGLIHCLYDLAFLDRFGVVKDMDLNRTLLTPEQFHENNEIRVQEMLASPYYRELKRIDAIDPFVAENPEEDESAESALPPAEPCPSTDEEDECIIIG